MSSGTGPFQWIGGLYYYKEGIKQPVFTTLHDQPQMDAAITAADVGDIYAARAAVETAAAEALTVHRDPAIFQRLENLVGQIEDAFARGDIGIGAIQL